MMKQRRFRRSTYLPLALLVYLAFMSYMGLPYFYSGDYLYYFGVIGTTLIVVLLLHISLKRREKLHEKRDNDAEYGIYKDNGHDA